MMGLRQIFESENISFVEVSEELIQDYLGMVNDIEHVDRFIGGWHEPYTEADEVRWVREQQRPPGRSVLPLPRRCRARVTERKR